MVNYHEIFPTIHQFNKIKTSEEVLKVVQKAEDFLFSVDEQERRAISFYAVGSFAAATIRLYQLQYLTVQRIQESLDLFFSHFPNLPLEKKPCSIQAWEIALQEIKNIN
jgi:hypothetical protein